MSSTERAGAFHSGVMHLNEILVGREAAAASAPELLLACHAHIRHFVQLGQTLATIRVVSIEEVVESSRALFRYFHDALPLHEADENESLYPRLLPLPRWNLVREAGEAMLEQHRAVNELVAELLPICEILKREPERLAVLCGHLQQVTHALGQVFAAHLNLEESVIFPALPELLTPEQMDAMLREMQARRRPPATRIHLVQ